MSTILPIFETETLEASPQSGLIETYLKLIEGQNKRLSAYEAALQEERNQLADIPRLIADLQCRLASEMDPGLVNILRAKLDEARADQAEMQRRVAASEARWPSRRDEMLADIDRFRAQLAKIGYTEP